jgi:hypothetical protein
MGGFGGLRAAQHLIRRARSRLAILRAPPCRSAFPLLLWEFGGERDAGLSDARYALPRLPGFGGGLRQHVVRVA